MTVETWHLRGTAEIVNESTEVFSAEQSQWHTVVRVTSVRLHILPSSSPADYAETIDFDG